MDKSVCRITRVVNCRCDHGRVFYRLLFVKQHADRDGCNAPILWLAMNNIPLGQLH